MTLSVFDLFKVGIGPSSSHTVGPMKAARMFAVGLRDDGLLPDVQAVRVCLYGSLGLTGKGHGSDKAVLLGLEGEQPATVEADAIPARLAAIADSGRLSLLGEHEIGFVTAEDLEFNRRKKLSYHPDAMRFTAYDGGGTLLRERDYYSVGGGFVADETEAEADQGAGGTQRAGGGNGNGGAQRAGGGNGNGGAQRAGGGNGNGGGNGGGRAHAAKGAKGTDPAIPVQDSSVLPYPFTTGAELLAHTTGSGLPV